MAIVYSNPRIEATITDWPHGAHRTTAHFKIETAKKGQRGTRSTVDPKTGRPSATKVLTYATLVRIVDGDDGRTYIAAYNLYDFITIMRGDMKYQEESIFPTDPRYAAVRALLGESR